MLENRLPVRIKPAAGLPKELTTGIVVGIFTTEMPVLGCIYAVDVEQPVSEEYPYQVVGIAECHLEPYRPDEVSPGV